MAVPSLVGDLKIVESFKIKAENEYEIQPEVFARVLKKRHPGKLYFTFFFFTKNVTVIYTEGG